MLRSLPVRCRAVPFAAMVAAAVFAVLAIAPATASAYPYVTLSYYEHSDDPTTLYNQGCTAGTKGANGLVILDFGRPAYSNGAYGLFDFGDHFDANSDVLAAAKSYADGFWDCTPVNGPFMTIAIGTVNFCPVGHSCEYQITNYDGTNNPNFTTAGARFGSYVEALNNYISSPPSYTSQESGGGSGDDEPGYDPDYTSTHNFVAGYNNTSDWAYFDYGSADPGQWPTLAYNYYVAYGATDDFPLPEIYSNDLAPEWENISLWGVDNGTYGAMYFEGPTVEVNDGKSCGDNGQQAYDALLQAVQSHQSTSQDSFDYITDLPCGTS